MNYGVEIHDSKGAVNLGGTQLSRFVASVNFSASETTTTTVSGFSTTTGIGFTRLDNPQGLRPTWTFNNSTKLLTITPNGFSGSLLLILRA